MLVALENIPLWHERDISHSSAERVILPDSTIALDYMLNLFLEMIEGLVINPERMRKNMELSHGLYASSKVLVRLMEKGVPRDEAYNMVQRCAMRSWEEGIAFEKALMEDKEVSSYLKEEELKEILNPHAFLKNIEHIYKRIYKEEIL